MSLVVTAAADSPPGLGCHSSALSLQFSSQTAQPPAEVPIRGSGVEPWACRVSEVTCVHRI